MDTRALIVNPGDIEGFATLSTLDRPERGVLWHASFGGPTSEQAAAAARRQAAFFAIDQVRIVRTRVDCEDTPGREMAEGIRHTDATAGGREASALLAHAALVLQAVQDAAALGCDSVVLPWSAGERPVEEASLRVEVQAMLTHLVELVLGPQSTIEILAPIFYLTDQEVVEIAAQTAAFHQAVWWCESAEDFPCGHCAACRRWFAALDQAGVTLGQTTAGAAATS